MIILRFCCLYSRSIFTFYTCSTWKTKVYYCVAIEELIPDGNPLILKGLVNERPLHKHYQLFHFINPELYLHKSVVRWEFILFNINIIISEPTSKGMTN